MSGRGEDSGYRVEDRRRVGREAPSGAPGAAGAKTAGESAPGGETADEARAAEAASITVADLARAFIAELHARAWIHMGLIVDPATKQLAKDLPQARLAIDCAASLVQHLTPFAETAELDELQGMLTNLRLNFVRQSSA
jgi:hypothetical protein